jgi:hypothetical protein
LSLQVRVDISYISAERFWGRDLEFPSSFHVSTNINVVGVEPKAEKLVVPFVATISYTPSIAQISIKGQAVASGTPEELEEVRESYRNGKAPPAALVQTITNTSLIEATIVSRSLNIPPPIPLPAVPQMQKQDKERPSYVG